MVTENIKRRVRNQFNRAALTYDLYCSVQNTVCLEAIHVLLKHQKVFGHVADFACGTGESTSFLIKHLECSSCYALDFAEELLAVARNKLLCIDNIEWIHHDFEQPIKINKPIELIFCNMGLQWSCNVPKTLHLWQSYLKHQGWILFSVPIAGNFPELKETIKPNLLTDGEMTHLLESIGLSLITKHFKHLEVKYADQLEILRALKATGTNYNKTLTLPIRGLKSIKAKEFFVNKKVSQLTYEIGIYLVRKI